MTCSRAPQHSESQTASVRSFLPDFHLPPSKTGDERPLKRSLNSCTKLCVDPRLEEGRLVGSPHCAPYDPDRVYSFQRAQLGDEGALRRGFVAGDAGHGRRRSLSLDRFVSFILWHHCAPLIEECYRLSLVLPQDPRRDRDSEQLAQCVKVAC